MEFLTRNKLVVGIAILLIALNLALIGTIGFRFLNGPKPTPEEQFNPEKAQEFVAKQLKLSSEQQGQFRQFRMEHMQEMRTIRKDIRDTYQQVVDELGSAEPNKEVLDSLSQRIGTLHTNQQNITTDHFLKLRSVCRPEQHAHLKKMLNRMMNNNPMMREHRPERSERPNKQRNRGNTDK